MIETPITVLQKIVDSEAIDFLSLFSYVESRRVQSKVNMQDENTAKLFERALALRSTQQFPFWDSLLASTFTISDFDGKVFTEAISHVDNAFYRNIDRAMIGAFASELDHIDDNLAVSSLVRSGNDQYMHICMIDFNIPFSETSTNLVRKLLKKLNQEGFLLCSGKSYHFYGRKLLQKEAYMDFLLRLILLSPIIDKNWAVHQLIRRQAFLRVTKKYGHYPFLVTIIE